MILNCSSMEISAGLPHATPAGISVPCLSHGGPCWPNKASCSGVAGAKCTCRLAGSLSWSRHHLRRRPSSSSRCARAADHRAGAWAVLPCAPASYADSHLHSQHPEPCDWNAFRQGLHSRALWSLLSNSTAHTQRCSERAPVRYCVLQGAHQHVRMLKGRTHVLFCLTSRLPVNRITHRHVRAPEGT